MLIVKSGAKQLGNPGAHGDLIELRNDDWDDDGLQTLFYAVVHESSGRLTDIGPVKIVQIGMSLGRPFIDDPLTELPQDFASIGQNQEYYERLLMLQSRVRVPYLRAMRDAANSSRILNRVKREDAWIKSALRFSQASNALEFGQQILGGKQQKREGVLSFTLHRTSDSKERVPPVHFSFDDSNQLPGRLNVVIGYNGSGKTRLLADLAVAASRVETTKAGSRASRSQLVGDDTNFGSVIAVSYSAFDEFARPSQTSRLKADTDFFGYIYCGLRAPDLDSSRRPGLKSFEDILDEFELAVEQSRDRDDQAEHLTQALRLLAQEPSFALSGVDLEELAKHRGNSRRTTFREFSTGHKIAIHIITQLTAKLRQRSLVLLDEPETHLHPPLMAALLRAIDYLLTIYDSFAVIATHSPVILQEVPAQYIQIISRTNNAFSMHRPDVETFGENIGSITRTVFNLDNSLSDFQGVLEHLASRYELHEVERLFAYGMSPTARALFLNYRARSSDTL